MKNFLRVLMLMLVLVLAISVMVACNDKTGDNTDGTTDGTDEEKGDTTQKLTVTFKYIDKAGNPLKDVDNYTESALKKAVKYGDDARDNKSGDVKLFDNYVIVGWNADKAAAMAGTVDENALKNVKSDITVYSVIREKVMKKVTFLKPDGTKILNTANNTDYFEYLEGSKIGREAPRPTVEGQYFKKWDFVSKQEADKTDSNESCIYGDCTFKAVMGATDGTIGKVAAGTTISVDGYADAAYKKGQTGAAYLALNNAKTSNNSYTIDETYTSNGEQVAGSYSRPSEVKADTWMVWDGEYIYLLIEVFDTKLTCRADSYVKKGIDSYFNDAIELWYTFEQDSSLTKNVTRVGVSASGDNIAGLKAGEAKYALPRSEYKGTPTGIGGGRSTHFDDIKYAVRNYIYDKENGKELEGLSADGNGLPSYVIELKIPAKTEGQADMTKAVDANGEKLKGTDLEEFRLTGRLYGKDAESNKIEDYAFTPGDDLLVGDYVRFCLQVNDLRIDKEDLLNSGNYFDAPSYQELLDSDEGTSLTQEEYAKVGVELFELDKETNKWVAVKTYDKFTAAGSTQHEVNMYLMFSLGGDENGSYKVASFKANATDRKAQIMVGTDGNEYTRVESAEE